MICVLQCTTLLGISGHNMMHIYMHHTHTNVGQVVISIVVNAVVKDQSYCLVLDEVIISRQSNMRDPTSNFNIIIIACLKIPYVDRDNFSRKFYS